MRRGGERNETGAIARASALWIVAVSATAMMSCTPFVGSYDGDAAVFDPCLAPQSHDPVFADSLSVSANHSCILASDKSVRCWGANRFGQLGVDLACNSTCPNGPCIPAGLRVLGLTALEVASGGGHTCALDLLGHAYCWGSNDFGELGVVDVDWTSVPSLVTRLPRTRDIACGISTTCALSTTRSIQCWGKGDVGQLGDGTISASRFEPGNEVRLDGGDVDQLFVGNRHACAHLSTGPVFCWGANERGQLGNAAHDMSSIPVQAMRAPGIPLSASRIALGNSFTCAVVDAQVLCWGANEAGQLGDGSLQDQIFPVRVGVTERVIQIAAGGDHACALTEGLTVFCWGSNMRMQLGPAATGETSPPVPIPSLSRVTEIGAGFNHTCAISDGSVFCWGLNDEGQLGDGTTMNRSEPSSVQFHL